MPKNKAWGENSKAAEAKARKAESQKTQKDKKDKAAEDAYWEDDDKHLAKKQGRKVVSICIIHITTFQTHNMFRYKFSIEWNTGRTREEACRKTTKED